MPRWPVWRVVSAGRATYEAIRDSWTLDEVQEANRLLDAEDDARETQERLAKARGGNA